MKKILFLAAVATIATTVNAQIVSSRSVSVNEAPQVSKSRDTEGKWWMHAAPGTNTFKGDNYEVDPVFGYQFGFEYTKPFSSGTGLFWGMDFSLNTRGYKYDAGWYGECKYQAGQIQYTPFLLGYDIAVNDFFSIRPWAGLYASFDVLGSYKYEDDSDRDYSIYDDDNYSKFDFGLVWGVDAVFDNSGKVGLYFQKGFLPEVDIDDYDISGGAFNFYVRFAFTVGKK